MQACTAAHQQSPEPSLRSTAQAIINSKPSHNHASHPLLNAGARLPSHPRIRAGISAHKPTRTQTCARRPSHPLRYALMCCSSHLAHLWLVTSHPRMRGPSELFVLGAGLPGCPSPATGRSSLPTTVVCWGRKPVCRRVRCREVTRCAGACGQAGSPPGRRAGLPFSSTPKPRRRVAQGADTQSWPGNPLGSPSRSGRRHAWESRSVGRCNKNNNIPPHLPYPTRLSCVAGPRRLHSPSSGDGFLKDLKGPKNTKGVWLMLHAAWLMVHAAWLLLHGLWLMLHAPRGPALAYAARPVGGLAFAARSDNGLHT